MIRDIFLIITVAMFIFIALGFGSTNSSQDYVAQYIFDKEELILSNSQTDCYYYSLVTASRMAADGYSIDIWQPWQVTENERCDGIYETRVKQLKEELGL